MRFENIKPEQYALLEQRLTAALQLEGYRVNGAIPEGPLLPLFQQPSVDFSVEIKRTDLPSGYTRMEFAYSAQGMDNIESTLCIERARRIIGETVFPPDV